MTTGAMYDLPPSRKHRDRDRDTTKPLAIRHAERITQLLPALYQVDTIEGQGGNGGRGSGQPRINARPNVLDTQKAVTRLLALTKALIERADGIGDATFSLSERFGLVCPRCQQSTLWVALDDYATDPERAVYCADVQCTGEDGLPTYRSSKWLEQIGADLSAGLPEMTNLERLRHDLRIALTDRDAWRDRAVTAEATLEGMGVNA